MLSFYIHISVKSRKTRFTNFGVKQQVQIQLLFEGIIFENITTKTYKKNSLGFRNAYGSNILTTSFKVTVSCHWFTQNQNFVLLKNSKSKVDYLHQLHLSNTFKFFC